MGVKTTYTRFTHKTKSSHETALKRICGYLQRTKYNGPYKKLVVDCYASADFEGLWGHEDPQDPIFAKSRTGFVVTFANCPLLWVSKLRIEIALSTLHSEYVSLYHSVREFPPLKSLIKEVIENLGIDNEKLKLVSSSTLYEENTGAIFVVKSTRMTPTSNHISIKYHWFRQHIGKEFVI